jgi:hypothetical protein
VGPAGAALHEHNANGALFKDVRSLQEVAAPEIEMKEVLSLRLCDFMLRANGEPAPRYLFAMILTRLLNT